MDKKLYEGPATIASVTFTELAPFKCKGMSETEINDAFDIHIVAEFPNDTGATDTAKITLEMSSRECVGTLAGKKQSEVTLENLERYDLIKGGDLGMLMGKVGAQIQIYQKQSNDGKYTNTYIGGGAAKIDPTEMARRLAKLNGVTPGGGAPLKGQQIPAPSADAQAPNGNPFD